MFAQIKSKDTTSPNVVELIADTASDIDSLPTYYSPGSTCIVTEGSRVFILNNNKEWVEL